MLKEKSGNLKIGGVAAGVGGGSRVRYVSLFEGHVIRRATEDDFGEWLRMRVLLYPGYTREVLLGEIEEIFRVRTAEGNLDWAVFVHDRGNSRLGGFVEASLRPSVRSCQTSPVGFIESFYVDADLRRRGIGRSLIQMAEAWARQEGCVEMAVDTDPWRTENPGIYTALGFAQVQLGDPEDLLFVKDLAHEK